MSDTVTSPASAARQKTSGAFQKPAEAARQASTRVRRLLENVPILRTREPRVAKVYDGCDAGRPWFDAEHAVIVDVRERERILQLLSGGGIVLHAAALLRDEITSEDGVVPGDLRSDGSWVWSEAASYYLEHHWIAPDPDLVAHLTAARPLALTHETWRRVYAAIRPDTWEGTTWPLD